MSGKGHLRELERMLDDAMRSFRAAETNHHGTTSVAYLYGITIGISRTIALIGNTTSTDEWGDSDRRIRDTQPG